MSAWSAEFGRTLAELGLPDVQARRLTEETLGYAAEAGGDPGAVFGPAHAYARHLVQELRGVPGPEERRAVTPGAEVLGLTGVGKSFHGRPVLRDVHLSVRAGQVAAIVGANGAGKSTLLRICAGLLRPDTGRVARRGRAGFVPQDGGTNDLLTAQEHFVLFGAAAGMSARRAVSTGSHLAAQLSWRPDPTVRVGQLSGGTRQKLSLVLGELHAPDLLLLDEPYQGFDQGTYLDFWNQVWRWRAAGKAIVLVTHLLHELDQVDHVVDLVPIEEGR
ncbi:MAG: ABC transporter ATP-binding protein [Kineosporiaceae bacterium]